MAATDGYVLTFLTPTAVSGTKPLAAPPSQPWALPRGSGGERRASDPFISMSVNAAVCPTIKEQEKGAVPRWQGSVPPESGASLEEDGHQAEQMLGAAAHGGGGPGEQLGPGRPPRRPRGGEGSMASGPHTCPLLPGPQGAPPRPARPGRQARAAAAAQEVESVPDRAGVPVPPPPHAGHSPVIRHHDRVEQVLVPGHGGRSTRLWPGAPPQGAGAANPRSSSGRSASEEAKPTSGGGSAGQAG